MNKLEAEIQVPVKPLRRVAVQLRILDLVEDAVAQVVSHRFDARRLFSAQLMAPLRRLSKADDGGNVQGAGAVTALLPSAVHQRNKTDARPPLPHIERADPFRSIYFMRRYGHQVDIQRVHIAVVFPERLNAVGVEQSSRLPRDAPNFGDRVDRPVFVVRPDNRDKSGFAVHGALRFVRVDHAVRVDIQIDNLKALFFKRLTSL